MFSTTTQSRRTPINLTSRSFGGLHLFGLRPKQREQFKKLAYPHTRFLYNVALKYMGNQYDAEDLVQETMYAAFRNFAQLRDHGKCRSWLFAILRSNFLKEKRQAIKRPLLSKKETYLEVLEGVAKQNTSRDYEAKLESLSLRALLDRLPEKYKTVLVLYFLEDLSYQAIAELIDVPIGTVMSRLSRAKQQMKKEMLREAMMNEAKIVDFRRSFSRRES